MKPVTGNADSIRDVLARAVVLSIELPRIGPDGDAFVTLERQPIALGEAGSNAPAQLPVLERAPCSLWAATP